MNDDYLWDRTGEPDPEIQQLEEVLSTLRYQPQPLELPAGIRPERQRRYFTPLAIAAAIALLMLAAGLWIRIHRVQPPRQGELSQGQKPVTGNEKTVPANEPLSTSGSDNQTVGKTKEERTPKTPINPNRRRLSSPEHSFAASRRKRLNSAVPEEPVSITQLEEARAAKDQLLLALRLASAKLNYAQRKTLGPPIPGTIRNQHKVG
jgi:hypothetical protein